MPLNSTACISTLDKLPTLAWFYTLGCVNIFISITASVENFIVIFVLLWYKNLHTLSNRILISLSFSDLCTGLLIAPLHAIQLLNENTRNSCAIDQVRRYLSTVLIGTSSLLIAAISYDRYLHMKKLQNYNAYMSAKKVRVMISICWIIPIVYPMLRLIDDSEAVYSGAVATMQVLILLILLGCYLMTLLTLHYKAKLLEHVTTSMATRQIRASVTVFIIITCYVSMILPLCGYFLAHVAGQPSSETVRSELYTVSITMAMLDSAINPLIYYFRNPTFRRCATRLVQLDLDRVSKESGEITTNDS